MGNGVIGHFIGAPNANLKKLGRLGTRHLGYFFPKRPFAPSTHFPQVSIFPSAHF